MDEIIKRPELAEYARREADAEREGQLRLQYPAYREAQPVEGDVAVMLRIIDRERAKSEGLRKALEDHHNWQLTQGTVWLEDLDGKPTISINGPAEYSDSDMCERTIAALSASPSPRPPSD